MEDERIKEENNFNKVRDSFIKSVNTILLTIVTLFLSIGGTIGISIMNNVNTKLDGLMIQSAILTTNSSTWEQRITNLESQTNTSKTEVLEAIENLRDYVEKYYERK